MENAASPAFEDRLLGIEEARSRLGMSLSTIYREIAAGRLQTVKIGSRRMVAISEINRYIRDLIDQASQAQGAAS